MYTGKMKNADYKRPNSLETFIASSTKTDDAEPVVIKLKSMAYLVLSLKSVCSP